MLPKIEYPLFDIYLKSLDRNVKFRPFLVKEEKILLMAKESKDANSIKLAVKQIITNCCAETLDVDNLPLFDIEMAFLKLRAKSMGESVKLVYNCKNKVEDIDCDTDNDYTLDLEKVRYETSEEHNPTIMITDTIGIKLKYPVYSTEINFDLDEDENGEKIIKYDDMLESLIPNIVCIFNADSVYEMQNIPDKELIEFITNLQPIDIARISRFFDTAPKVVLEDKVTCKKCGFEHTLHTENLLDFFI